MALLSFIFLKTVVLVATWKYRLGLACAEIQGCIFFHETRGNFTTRL